MIDSESFFLLMNRQDGLSACEIGLGLAYLSV